MTANRKQVCLINTQSKAKLSSAVSAAWGRVSHDVGKGKFADDGGMDTVTVNRALTGPSLPSAEHLLNSLAADPTALDEVLALYGLAVRPAVATACADMELLGALGHALSEYIDRMRDGKRCHNDTLALAMLFRPLIPQMASIVDEADALRVRS
jgi:hypothetical protein